MIDHYNAFISYKHAPLDSKIAARVQRKLEHFTVPPKIAKSCGKKKIERVFRDKDELPITADLSETISHALENSDYLIVICSPETKKSIWVQREIEFFLQNHTRKEVLTVLADGDPYEVIPEILLKEEKTITDEDGREHKVTVDLEPLSCDYTIPVKKADKIEIPRLAAALLACSYDELMDRNRQYRMRRMALVFALVMSLMIAFGSYLYNSRKQIRESYIDSLKSTSRYRANESEKLYREQKRLDAIRLALAALPEDDEFDVMPEALRALNDSTLAYHSLAGNSIESEWNYYMPNDIRSFEVSNDRTRFAVADEGNTVIMWDTDTHEEVIHTTYSGPVNGISFIDDDTLAVWGSNWVFAYNIADGSVKWELSDNGVRGLSSKKCVPSESGDLYLLSITDNVVYRIDGDTGEIMAIYHYETVLIDEMFEYVIDIGVSPDETKLFIITYFVEDGFRLAIIDMENDTCTKWDGEISNIDCVTWTDNDHVVLASPREHDVSYATTDGGYVMEEQYTDILCVDANTLDLVWSSEFSSSQDEVQSGFLMQPALGRIMYYSSNRANSYDLDDGQLVTSYETNGPLILASDVDGDGFPILITSNGNTLSPVGAGDGDGRLISYHEFPDDVEECIIGGGIYIRCSVPNEIIYYNVYVSDDEWEEVAGGTVYKSYPDLCRIFDDIIVIRGYDPMGTGKYDLIDPYKNECIASISPTTSEGVPVSLALASVLGTYNDTLYVGYDSMNGVQIYTYNYVTGEEDCFTLGSNTAYSGSSSVVMQDKYIMMLQRPDYDTHVCIYDIEKGETLDYVVSDIRSVLKTDLMYISGSEQIIIPTDDGTYILDIETGEYDILPPASGLDTVSIGAMNSDCRRLALTDNQKIVLFNRDLELLAEITCNSYEPLAMEIVDVNGESNLFVVYGNGYMYRYDATNGEYRGRTKLTEPGDRASISYDPASGLIYVNTFSATDVIEPDSWYEIASVPFCIGHHSGSDTFYTVSFIDTSAFRIGRFRRYTLDELVAKAEAILGDSEMSDELRDDYDL